MPYPLEQITPETPDAEKEAAVKATIEQMVSEGKSPEEAEQMVMQMVQDLMASAGSEQWPSQQPTEYGPSMQNPNSVFMRGKQGNTGKTPGMSGYRNVMNERYTNFNPGFLSDGRVSDR